MAGRVVLPEITVAAKAATIVGTGSPNAEFILTRTGDPAAALTVGIAVTGGGLRTSSPPTEAEFAVGSATVEVSVPVNPVGFGESSESATLTVQPGTGYMVGVSPDNAATVTVAAPAGPVIPNITVAAEAASVVGGENAVFTLTRTGDTASRLTVTIGVTGAAASGAPTTAMFSMNMATVEVSVPTNTIAADAASQTVTLTVQAGSGSAYTVGSASTAMVTVGPMPSGGAPAVTGLAKVDETLTSTAGTIEDSDGLTSPTYTYQWQRQGDNSAWADISGATSATYTLVTADRFRKVRVIYSFMDDGSNAETRTSAPYPAGAATVDPIDNIDATGAPAISGSESVDSTLTASTTSIMDGNGLIGVAYSYQWQSADEGQTNWTDISGATSSSYTVVAADEGRILRVVVMFRDEDRHQETLSSSSTAAIMPALAFTVEATTNAAVEPAFGASATAANRLVFEVTPNRAPDEMVTVRYSFSGTATEGRDYESHPSKELTFSAGSTAAQEITVSAIGDIVAEGASGETVTVTVEESVATGTFSEPAAQISVATTAPSFSTENGMTVVSFSFLPLARAPSSSLDVEWRVEVEGNAGSALGRSAGARATASCTVRSCGGTVTYAAGSTTLADPVIEAQFDTELASGTDIQVQVRRPAATANLAVVPSTDVSVNDQIADSDWVVAGFNTVVAQPPAALVHAVAGAGRLIATSIVDGIWRRADARRAGGMTPHATLGGRVLDTHALSSGDAGRAVREVASLIGLEATAPDASFDGLDSGHGGGIDDYRAWAGIPDRSRLIGQSSFALSAGSGKAAFWGEFSTNTRESEPEEGSSVESESSDILLGFDMPGSGNVLYGLAVSRSSGESEYKDAAGAGAADTSVLTFAPYVHWTGETGRSFWGSFGIGSGSLEMTNNGRMSETDIGMTMLAAGARSASMRRGRADFAIRGDIFRTAMDADKTAGFNELSAEASRIRVALERVSGRTLDSGAASFSRMELGARMDSGDGEEGAGADVAAEFRYASPNGLEVTGRLGTLLLHSQEGFSEWGAGLGIAYASGSDGRGASLSLKPTWNAPRAGVSESMWMSQDLGGYASSDAGAAMKTRLGYGVGTMRDRALATLYGETESGGDSQRLRLGAEMRGMAGPLERLSLDVYGEREETLSPRPNDSIMLEGRLGF